MRDSGKTTYPIDELIEAIKENRDITEIAQIISGIDDINQADKNQYTALHIAAIYNNLKIVKKLLAHDANANLVDSDGSTALYWAAMWHNREMVKVLIAHGADETSLIEVHQTQFAEVIAEGILIRNTRNSACALAGIGQELQRVSLIQNHPCIKLSERQKYTHKLPDLTEPILAQIAAYATNLPRPNNLTQEQIKKCAEVGTESLAITDENTFNETDKKFVAIDPRNTILKILDKNQNPANGQRLGG